MSSPREPPGGGASGSGSTPPPSPPRPAWDSTYTSSHHRNPPPPGASRSPTRGAHRPAPRPLSPVASPGRPPSPGAPPRLAPLSPPGSARAGLPAPLPDLRSPATRKDLADASPADLLSSPLAPLRFDPKRLAAQAPARSKDSALVSLSKQLDEMRERLRATEAAAVDAARAARESAETSKQASADVAASQDKAAQAASVAPPAPPPPAEIPPAPPRVSMLTQLAAAPASGPSTSSSARDRSQHVAILKLEEEIRDWRARFEVAERREKDARADAAALAEKARVEALAETAGTRKALDVLRYRAAHSHARRFAERRLRSVLGAFHREVRRSRAARLDEAVALARVKADEAFESRAREEREAHEMELEVEREARLAAEDAAERAHRRAADERDARRRVEANAMETLRNAARESKEERDAIEAEVRARVADYERSLEAATSEARRTAEAERGGRLEAEATLEATARDLRAARKTLERGTAATLQRLADRRRLASTRDACWAWREMTARRRVVRVAVSRARAVWRRAKLARFAKAWRAFAAASASARATAALEHVHAWRAEAEKASRLEAAEARAAALFVPRRTRHAMREWRRATASSRAATLASKITELEGAKATLEAEREALRRAADVDRAAAREAAEREEETKASLAAAETRAAATAPFGGGLLESPLAWRRVEPAEASPDDASLRRLAGTALPDPAPPVFIPDLSSGSSSEDLLFDASDGEPSASGVAVVLLAGAAPTMKALALRVDVEQSALWSLEPTTRWVALDDAAVAGTAPAPRERPATCALPAGTAAVAAAAAGADPAGVVGGLFVYGGYDGEDETNDAHVLLRRAFDDETTETKAGGDRPPLWEWVRLDRAPRTPAPPKRSHASAFATPPPFVGSPAASAHAADVWVMGGYRSGAASGGLRNDLWRLDATTLTWSNPEMFGDVPPPRRDAAIAVTSVSSSGVGRVFVHGGCAADGEALADAYTLDVATLEWARLPPDEPGGGGQFDDSFEATPEYGVAAEMALLAEKARAETLDPKPSQERPLNAASRPALVAHPGARSRHAACVVGGSLVVHGGAGRRGSGAVSAAFVHVLDLETMAWRLQRAAPEKASRAALDAHAQGHLLFPHAAGVMLVGNGSEKLLAKAPPLFLLELAGAREGRKLRERDVRAAEREGREADEARRAVALAEAAKDESELVRRAARELRERLRLALSDAREGRERQRALRAKLASERRRLDDAYDREGDVRRAAEDAEAKAEAASASAREARRERDESRQIAREAREKLEDAERRAKAAEAKATTAEGRATEAARDVDAAARSISKAMTTELEREMEALRSKVERAEAKAEAAEAVRTRVEAEAAEARDREARAAERTRAAEAARAVAARDAEETRKALRGEIEALEEEVAKATRERWARELDTSRVGETTEGEGLEEEGLPDRLVAVLEGGARD